MPTPGNIKMFIGKEEIFVNKSITHRDNQINYVKDHISKALKIDNLNFLLGAGCSSYYKDGNEIGISTMAGLFIEFINKIKASKTSTSSSSSITSKFLIDFVDNIETKFDSNLEKLLEYLIASYVCLDQLPASILKISGESIEQEQIQTAINDVKKFIIEKILNTVNSKDTEVIELYKTFYQKIVNNNRKRPINIFTTNYDVFNEKALDDLGFLYNNGFSGTVNRTFNQMLYNYMFVENMNLNKNIYKPVSYYFNLVKLHGSITWEADRDNFKIYENTNFKCDTIDNFFNKVMIYPSPLKDRSTLMTPYSDLFRFLENSLYLNNSTLIVIGYSFSDQHINRLIYNALANPTFRLIIFNDSDEVMKLIDNNDKRITVIYSEISDKCKEISHYFDYIVREFLPSINDDLEEKDRIDKMLNNLNTIFKDNEK